MRQSLQWYGNKHDMSVLNVFLSTLWCSTIATVYIRPCEQYSRDICQVRRLSITPCNDDKKCIVKTGDNVSISIDFTPNFKARYLKTGVFWNLGYKEWPLQVIKSNDACTFTNCPIEVGKTQRLTYNTTSIGLIGILPPMTYKIRWKMWNEENMTQVCCLQTNVIKKRTSGRTTPKISIKKTY